jgi:hypothetical protein
MGGSASRGELFQSTPDDQHCRLNELESPFLSGLAEVLGLRLFLRRLPAQACPLHLLPRYLRDLP